MRIGAVFPQTEIGADPGAVRAWAEAVEELGFRHVVAFDHVLGAGTAGRPGWYGYTSEDLFHEVFVLFGYLAGITRTLELVTGVLVLPQRQTALVAKQAAEVDVLSGGRLRLGVGIGWNRVEYDALGATFTDRGARSAEQVEVLRALWAEPTVTYQGRWHRIEDAGILPRPVRGRIPVWFGGNAEPVLRRAGELGDGWLPQRRRTRRLAPWCSGFAPTPSRPGAIPLRSGLRRASSWRRCRRPRGPALFRVGVTWGRRISV